MLVLAAEYKKFVALVESRSMPCQQIILATVKYQRRRS